MIETHSTEYVIGMLCGFIFVILLVIIIAILRKGNKEKCHFDERQQSARGRAYQIGFFTMMIYFGIYGLVDMLGVVWCETSIGLFIGILIGVAVFALTAIRNDAYLAINENIKTFSALGIIVVVVETVVTVLDFLDGSIIDNGKLTTNSIGMFVGLLWLVILAALSVHNYRIKLTETADKE